MGFALLVHVAPEETDIIRLADLARVEAWRVVRQDLDELKKARERGRPLPTPQEAYVLGLVHYYDKRFVGGIQEFAPVSLVLHRGFAHCVDLCCWEIACQILAGARAADPSRPIGQAGCVDFLFQWWPQIDPTMGHVSVRQADGKIKDISRLCGM